MQQSVFPPRLAGLVTGLAAEARIARRLGPTRTGGGRPAGAEDAAARLVAEGATALISFGLCGGLDPALPAGALVVPRRVLAGARRHDTDPDLSAWLGGWSAEALLAPPDVVADAAAKAALFAATGAEAVDLESGAVAAVAARHGLPFAVLRAVCDPAGLALPPLALLALDAAGGLRPRRIAASLLARPGQLGTVLRLARAARAARRALLHRVGDILRDGARDRRAVP